MLKILAFVGIVAIPPFIALAWLAASGQLTFRAPESVPLGREETPPGILGLQAMKDIPGTSLVAIWEGIRSSIVAHDDPQHGIDYRNITILDRATGASRHLLPDQSRRIMGLIFLPGSATGPVYATQLPGGPMAYFLMSVRTGDGAHDDLMVGDLRSGRQAFVLLDAGELWRVWMADATHMGLLTHKSGVETYQLIDMTTLKLASKRRVGG